MSIEIDLDDISEFDPDLAEAIGQNTRRYVNLFSDIISEILPDYKDPTLGVSF